MATTETTSQKAGAVYQLEGTLLEACSCGVLCPCWIGEDPDGGECYAFNAYHFDSGQIGGVDVSGMNLVNVVHIPGNVLTPGSWRVLMIVDDTATDEQKQAIVGAFRGEYGGPLADLAGLVGEVIDVVSRPVHHDLADGTGTLRVEGWIDAELEPYTSMDGTITTLRDSKFSTVPGSPAWVAKAKHHRVDIPDYGLSWEYENRNAIQAVYKMEYAG
jgi:hypothetical protein